MTDIVTTSTTATVLTQGIPGPPGVPPGGYGWIAPEQYGAVGNGTTNDAAAVQAALNALAASCAAGNALQLRLARRYLIVQTDPTNYGPLLTITNVVGGKIVGNGTGQSALVSSSLCSPSALLQRTNCYGLALEDFDLMHEVATATGPIQSGAALGATTLVLSSNSAAALPSSITTPVPVTIVKWTYWYEENRVISRSGTTVTLERPLQNPYDTGDIAVFAVRYSLLDWSDAGQSGYSSQNYCRNVGMGAGALNACLYGHGIDCVGGTGSTSDRNNASHVDERVSVGNPVIAGAYVGHLNSVTNTFRDCALSNGLPFHAIHAPRGGNWIVEGNTSLIACQSLFEIGGGSAYVAAVTSAISETSAAILVSNQWSARGSFVAVAFTQPAPGATVQITVGAPALTPGASNWCNPSNVGGPYYEAIGGGGFYQLVSVDSATQITIKNLGNAENLAAGLQVPAGATIGLAWTGPVCRLSGLQLQGATVVRPTTQGNSAADTVLHFATAQGFRRGQVLGISQPDGTLFERKTILSVNAGAATVTLTAGLTNAQSLGAVVSPLYAIDVSSARCYMSLDGGWLAYGQNSAPGNELHVCDITGTEHGKVRGRGCDSGMVGYTLDSAIGVFSDFGWSSITGASPRSNLLNGASATNT